MLTYNHKKNPLNDASHVKGQIRKLHHAINICQELECPNSEREFKNRLRKLQKIQAEHQQIAAERTEWDNI
jgi:hypothetical protein